jgi:hypothetical protein
MEHGWSQSAIAARTGQTRRPDAWPEVSDFLRSDRRVITHPLLERIATAFNIPRAYLGLAYAEDLADYQTEEPEDPMRRRQLLGSDRVADRRDRRAGSLAVAAHDHPVRIAGTG